MTYGFRRVCCALVIPGAARSRVLTRRTCRAGPPMLFPVVLLCQRPQRWQPVDRSPSWERGAPCTFVGTPTLSVSALQRCLEARELAGSPEPGRCSGVCPSCPRAPQYGRGSQAPGDASMHRVWWGVRAGWGPLGGMAVDSVASRDRPRELWWRVCVAVGDVSDLCIRVTTVFVYLLHRVNNKYMTSTFLPAPST